MELIAKHAKHLPTLDNFIIKRINNFGCYYWHLNIGAGINNYTCLVHAIAIKHNKCFFKLLKYYSSGSTFCFSTVHLMHMCAYYDNLEALKYTCGILPKFITTQFNFIINYAVSGASFKCAIFCLENQPLIVDKYFCVHDSFIHMYYDLIFPTHTGDLIVAKNLRCLKSPIRRYIWNNNLVLY